jgi:hypothetical protein
MATQIHSAERNPATVPSPTIGPARANPSDEPTPKAALLIPGSDPGSSGGACDTSSGGACNTPKTLSAGQFRGRNVVARMPPICGLELCDV